MTNNVIDAINIRFSHLAGMDVVIYGMGQLADALTNNRDRLIFNIAGVMDRDKTEGYFNGIRVVNTDNFYEAANIIIIAALGSSCPIIYDRISFLRERGVDIYFPDGEKRSAREETLGSEYFINVRKKLTRLIDANDIISFDVFDTLVMRRCLFPHEVFSMLEERRREPGFAAKRIQTGKSAWEKLGRHPDIYDIYELMGLPRSDAGAEIEAEKEMLAARGDILYFYEYATKSGKPIILTSDMYLPGEIMSELLGGCGISGYDKLYVSCDMNQTKRDGGIWDKILNEHPCGDILHIGDNTISDNILQPRISSFLIRGTVEAADLLGFSEAIAAARGFWDYYTIGTVLEKLLTLDLTRTEGGKIIIDKPEDIGYCFIAPQTFGFVTWLARVSSENRENELYFCARDAYMFMRLYEKIRKQYDAPDFKYLYISKRALCGVLSDSLSNIRQCLEYYYSRFDSKTTVKDAIFRLFGAVLPVDEFTALSVKETDTESLAERIEDCYFDIFRKNAEIEKANFEKYLKANSIGEHNAALVDYICGQSVNLAGKLFGGNFYLYGATDNELNINAPDGNVYSWLEKTELPQLPYYYIMKHSQFGEAVYSSPEGTCLMFDGNGVPVLDNEHIDFSANNGIYDGVERFCRDVRHPAGCETADRIFGALFSGNYAFESAVNGLTWSSYTANKGETQI